jgi:hypothetical protein
MRSRLMSTVGALSICQRARSHRGRHRGRSSTSRLRGRARSVWTSWTGLTATVPGDPPKAICARQEENATAADFYVVFPNVPKRDNSGT